MTTEALQRAAICDRCEHRKGRICRFDGVSIAEHVAGRVCRNGRFGNDQASNAETPTKSGPLQALFVAPALHNPGGIERWLVALARYIPEVSGGAVQVPAVIVRHPAGAAPEMIAELSRYTRVVLYGDATRGEIRRLAAAADVIVASGVNVNLASGAGVVESLVSGATCPVVFCSHSCCAYSEVLSQAALESGLVRYWTSVGHTAQRVFPDAIADQVTAIENGAEVERCAPIRGRAWQRHQWGISHDQVAIGYIGRLHHEKRVTALAEALQHLPGNYVGLVYGTGIHADDIIAESQRLAGDRIRFLGCVSYLGDVLAGLDAWLLASPAEGFCLARVEAQLAGVPVLTTPTGELPRLEATYGQLTWPIRIGATGRDIAGVIQRAIADRTTTRTVTDRARTLAWERYTATAMAGRWVDYFQSIARR